MVPLGIMEVASPVILCLRLRLRATPFVSVTLTAIVYDSSLLCLLKHPSCGLGFLTLFNTLQNVFVPGGRTVFLLCLFQQPSCDF